MAAFGELVQGLSTPDVLERINRHFEVQRTAPAHIDKYTAEVPLPLDAAPPEGQPAEKGSRP